MPKINELYTLVGNLLNLDFFLHSGEKVNFLDNNSMDLGNQALYQQSDAGHYEICLIEQA